MIETTSGLCECGCGGIAPLATQTVRSRGWVKGQPHRYIKNHAVLDPRNRPTNYNRLPFTEEQLLEMEKLYRMGFSTLEIGKRFNCLGGSVHTRLVARGVQMRSSASKKRRWGFHSSGYIRFGESYIHRIVAEAWFERELGPDEHVHHIDGDKRNNHPDNLEILSAAEHHRRHYRGRQIDAAGRLV